MYRNGGKSEKTHEMYHQMLLYNGQLFVYSLSVVLVDLALFALAM